MPPLLPPQHVRRKKIPKSYRFVYRNEAEESVVESPTMEADEIMNYGKLLLFIVFLGFVAFGLAVEFSGHGPRMRR